MLKTILEILNFLRDFNIYSILFRLLLAVLLGGVIGIERSKTGRAAGLRTHILVCLGSTIASLTGLFIFEKYGSAGDVTRIAAQVISGIGFLGAGTILVKNKSTVTGLTTSACVWAIGTIGIAIGFGFYEAAIFGAFLIFFITGMLGHINKKAHLEFEEAIFHIEFKTPTEINSVIKEIQNNSELLKEVNFLPTRNPQETYIATEIIALFNENVDIYKLSEKFNKNEKIYFSFVHTKKI